MVRRISPVGHEKITVNLPRKSKDASSTSPSASLRPKGTQKQTHAGPRPTEAAHTDEEEDRQTQSVLMCVYTCTVFPLFSVPPSIGSSGRSLRTVIVRTNRLFISLKA